MASIQILATVGLNFFEKNVKSAEKSRDLLADVHAELGYLLAFTWDYMNLTGFRLCYTEQRKKKKPIILHCF